MRARLLFSLLLTLVSLSFYGQTTEEISIQSRDGHLLSGTLTLPAGKASFPCIILISGSGPQDRNEEILGHKPFEAIALYMQSRGVAVFRYDDRGVGKSTGSFSAATSADFAQDAAEVFDVISTHSKINGSKVGFAGHSEGGMVAAMAFSLRKNVAFIMSLAGTGVTGKALLSQQNYDIVYKMGLGAEEAKKKQKENERMIGALEAEPDSVKAQSKLVAHLDSMYASQRPLIPNYENYINDLASQLNSKWMRYFISYDPAQDWSKVTCPVLILNGSEDVQVHAQINMNAIATSLEKGGNDNYKLVMLHGQNHLFQNCKSCTLSEYGTLEEDFSQEAMEEMLTWLTAALR